MAHSNIHFPKYIPKIYLEDIQSIEWRCIATNAICLITISISCLRNIEVIRRLHDANPQFSIIEICRASYMYDVVCDMLFIILPLHLITWKLRVNKFVCSLDTVRKELAYPFKIYAQEISYDGSPLRFSIYASLCYMIMQEGYLFFLSEDFFLSHIVTLQAIIALTIFMTGIAYVSSKQKKHIQELDDALKSDPLNT